MTSTPDERTWIAEQNAQHTASPRVCTNCGATDTNPDSGILATVTCINCGVNRPIKIINPHDWKQRDGSMFCTWCGEEVSSRSPLGCTGTLTR